MKTKEKKDEFKIRIAGVEIGKYSYSMTCDKEFFEISELSDLQDGCLNLQVEMDKSENKPGFKGGDNRGGNRKFGNNNTMDILKTLVEKSF